MPQVLRQSEVVLCDAEQTLQQHFRSVPFVADFLAFARSHLSQDTTFPPFTEHMEQAGPVLVEAQTPAENKVEQSSIVERKMNFFILNSFILNSRICLERAV